MSIATLTQEARQSLARALEALQASDAPKALLTVAEPLAKAVGALVELERAEHPGPASVEPALGALREGLRLLQLPEHFRHAAAERSMSAVAEALRFVNELAEALRKGDARDPAPVAVPSPAKNPAGFARTALAGSPGAPAAAPVQAAPAPAVPVAAKAAPAAQIRNTSEDVELRAVEAELGAHSATNFYKGLASGDIVTSGGLFVATYQVPPVGQKVLLKVSMPGGYEFEAKGVVAWTREVRMSSTAPGATPGFGAQFSEITDEGRGLIQRYVRNREPLFHDDL
jgi:Tfp pilus assembly protein PilZ